MWAILGGFLLFCLIGTLVSMLIAAGGIAAILGIIIIVALFAAIIIRILGKI
ncbi:MAG: hypothetical protein J6A04_05770 [Clostridia bacterium]|nr:hypothetical protein [Clostridia bacterium]